MLYSIKQIIDEAISITTFTIDRDIRPVGLIPVGETFHKMGFWGTTSVTLTAFAGLLSNQLQIVQVGSTAASNQLISDSVIIEYGNNTELTAWQHQLDIVVVDLIDLERLSSNITEATDCLKLEGILIIYRKARGALSYRKKSLDMFTKLA